MYVIVGLGNPDKKYEHTRHNIGFDVIDALADKYNISVTDKKHKALCGSGGGRDAHRQRAGGAGAAADLHEPKRRVCC